jgi:hypothetical protein
MTKISSEQHEALLRELESKGKEIDETARHIQAIKNKLDNTELSEEFFWKLSQIRWDLTASRDEYTDAVAQWKQTQDNLNSFPLRFFPAPAEWLTNGINSLIGAQPVDYNALVQAEKLYLTIYKDLLYSTKAASRDFNDLLKMLESKGISLPEGSLGPIDEVETTDEELAHRSSCAP